MNKEEPERLSLTPIPEKEGLMIGVKKDGKTYTVRKDRSRYFFPDEWKAFVKELNPNRRFLFLTLLQTGARIDEALHLRAKDINIERKTLTLYVTKSKAKKGETAERGGKPRAFSVSSEYIKDLKRYLKDNKIDEFSDALLFKVTPQGVSQLLKRTLKKIGITDYYNFSLHNIRKTHGMWLKTLQSRGRDLDISEICMRLGHDHNTFLKHYGSPSIFGDQDRDKMIEILGDVYGLR